MSCSARVIAFLLSPFIGLNIPCQQNGSATIWYSSSYFAGMYTAVLPMIPGIYAIYRLTKAGRHTQRSQQEETQPASNAKAVRASTRHKAGSGAHGPVRTRTSWLQDFFSQRLRNSALLFGVFPVGTAFGRWISKTIALPQLRKLAAGNVPWTLPRKPISESTVVLVSTGGVHLKTDHPFNLNGDPTFPVIPKGAEAADLAISHQAYDRTDALRDINLVFPIERLRELEAEHAIGRLAEEHYGFGLMPSAKRLMPAIKEVARRISEAGVDLALLVPA
jgi:D-proline reductase (dithiol) PrdB